MWLRRTLNLYGQKQTENLCHVLYHVLCLYYSLESEGKILMISNSSGMHTIAAQLLGSGASINDTMSDGQTLLHMAIQRQDSKSALFLLEHQADINVR